MLARSSIKTMYKEAFNEACSHARRKLSGPFYEIPLNALWETINHIDERTVTHKTSTLSEVSDSIKLSFTKIVLPGTLLTLLMMFAHNYKLLRDQKNIVLSKLDATDTDGISELNQLYAKDLGLLFKSLRLNFFTQTNATLSWIITNNFAPYFGCSSYSAPLVGCATVFAERGNELFNYLFNNSDQESKADNNSPLLNPEESPENENEEDTFSQENWFIYLYRIGVLEFFASATYDYFRYGLIEDTLEQKGGPILKIAGVTALLTLDAFLLLLPYVFMLMQCNKKVSPGSHVQLEEIKDDQVISSLRAHSTFKPAEEKKEEVAPDPANDTALDMSYKPASG